MKVSTTPRALAPLVLFTLLGLAGGLLPGCNRGERQATVTLHIDGKDASYETARAEIDRVGIGGPTSVYLMRDEAKGEHPYVGVRYYSGNPVAHLWLRAPDGGELGSFECYVPGTLGDGRPTLGWTKPDGTPRNRQETGEADCRASVSRTDEAVELTFDALVAPRVDKGAKDGETRRIHIEGSARVKL